MITPFIEVRNAKDEKVTGFERTCGANRVFTNVHFDANQVVLKFSETRLLTKEQIANIASVYSDEFLQIGKELYLDLTGDITKFIKHSCNPNTAVKIMSRTAFLVSTRAIKPNEELTFDYSITSNEMPDTWQMACDCGSWNCRKSISGFNTLSEKDQKTFIAQGFVPTYITKVSAR